MIKKTVCKCCGILFLQNVPYRYKPRKCCSKKCIYSLITQRASQNFSKRFSDKFKINPETNCWEWVGNLFRTGYGVIFAYGKQMSAHRVSWKKHYGDIPKNYMVCHKCDNRKCVNPKHLFLGTYRDNIDDMVRKKRSLIGERHKRSKLKNVDVLTIRRLKKNGIRSIELAKQFNISRHHVARIVRRLAWSHI